MAVLLMSGLGALITKKCLVKVGAQSVLSGMLGVLRHVSVRKFCRRKKIKKVKLKRIDG